jgi:hypothetical protein
MRRRDFIARLGARPSTVKEFRKALWRRIPPMRKFTILAVSGTFVLAADTFALADSKSAADFLIETCLPAMDNVSKVEAMAREGNWTPKPDLNPPSQFRTSNSRWEVTKGEEKFSVFVWINHLAQQDYNICFVNFLSKNVNREEFLRFVTASLELTLISDTRMVEIQKLNELYRIKSDRSNPIQLGIVSKIADGSVEFSSITEMFRPQVAPAAPTQNGR